MATAEQSRKRKANLTARNLCVTCGQRPPTTHKRTGEKITRCRSCQDKISSRGGRLKARGLCTKCGKVPPETGKTRCRPCADQYNRLKAERTARLIADGTCTHCGKRPAAQDRQMCEKCLRYHREKKAEMQAQTPQGKARTRDGAACRLCGNTTLRLIGHHIDGSGHDGHGNRSAGANDDPANLVTLCNSCHRYLHKFVRYTTDFDLLISLLNGLYNATLAA